jgi:hypothetical protein
MNTAQPLITTFTNKLERRLVFFLQNVTVYILKIYNVTHKS